MRVGVASRGALARRPAPVAPAREHPAAPPFAGPHPAWPQHSVLTCCFSLDLHANLHKNIYKYIIDINNYFTGDVDISVKVRLPDPMHAVAANGFLKL